MDTTETITKTFYKGEKAPSQMEIKMPIPNIYTPNLKMIDCFSVAKYELSHIEELGIENTRIGHYKKIESVIRI